MKQRAQFMFLCLLTISTTLVISLRSQGRSNEIRFVHIHSSPIKMTLNRVTGFVDTEIVSPGNITAYRFGCIAQSQGRYLMRRRFEKTVANFREREYFLNRASLENLANRCKSKEVVAIVEVEFEDGAQWKLR